ncbi:hypothetical protein KY343_07265 [Candidatus Woesearchaeota archaeon]|nr:hypothetical protein [Candidatus Woesearchaeota archaeon]
MIIKDKTLSYKLVCDGGCETELIAPSFQEVVDIGKEEKWKFNTRIEKNNKGEKTIWEHYCPSCREIEGI